MAGAAVENVDAQVALDAVAHLHIRDLPEHVLVGPLPTGAFNPSTLPLQLVTSNQQNLVHVFDVVTGVDPGLHLKSLF